MFDMRKNWHYSLRASEQDCEIVFREAFKPAPPSLRKLTALTPEARWGVGWESVEGDSGRMTKGLVATLERPSFLRSMTREGQAGVGTKVAFVIDHSAEGASIGCQLFLLEAKMIKKSAITPAYIANTDILKKYFKRVHKGLLQLDPELSHQKMW